MGMSHKTWMKDMGTKGNRYKFLGAKGQRAQDTQDMGIRHWCKW